MSKPIDQIKTEILDAIIVLRGLYITQHRSWGRPDADRWFSTQVDILLSKLETAVREQTIEKIEGLIKNDIGYALRSKPMPEVDDILKILDSLKSDTQASEEGENI